jgi:Cof subfamily protein (haloacid dehalogenase superfamily)
MIVPQENYLGGFFVFRSEMMTKMIVTDMDGTLLNSDLKVSQRNLDAIAKVRALGIKFVVATGRPDQLVKEYIEPLEMTEPMILYNGSVIGHPFQEKRIYEQRLSKDDVRDICQYCQDNDIICMAYSKTKIISKPNYRVRFFEERNEKLPHNARSVFENIENIDVIADEYSVQKILIIENDLQKYQSLKNRLEQQDKFTIATSQKGFIDVNPKGSSKGNALKHLAEYYNIDLNDVIVFGDQENDISMLQIAGTSIAMGNADAYVKEHADFVTLSNNEDGVAVWLEHNLLNKCAK